jgi:hypothetical protein
MINALKILILPALFVLPWVVMKLNNGDKFVQETISNQPILVILFLLPSIIISLVWVFKILKR